MRNLSNSCCHNVCCAYCTNDTAPLKSTFAILDSGRSEFRNNCEILPYFSFQSVLCKFFTKNCIRFTNSFQTITCDSTWAANTKSRSREWLTINHTMCQTKFITNNTNLILKQDSDWLYEFKSHILRKSTCIMMSLDSFF